MYRKVGEQVAQYKIVGIFDVWLPETPQPTKVKPAARPTKLANSDF